jgi:hypothetical protein
VPTSSTTDAEISRARCGGARPARALVRRTPQRLLLWPTGEIPPPSYTFCAAEFDLGVGRVDLVWFDKADNVVVDEIKTGNSRSLRVKRTLEQKNDFPPSSLWIRHLQSATLLPSRTQKGHHSVGMSA